MAALPPRADVVIVGGGFAGAATAYHLVHAGVRDVVVVERESTCGYHASGRNAALARQLTDLDEVTEHTVRGAAFVREPPDGFAEAPLLAPSGSVLLADDAASLDTMAARATRYDLAHERVAPADLTQRWPLLAGLPCAGGVFFPGDGVIDVHALLLGYLAGARRGGARVETRCEVTALAASDDGRTATVETTRGAIAARCVVSAAGAWAGPVGALAGSRATRYAPIKRHLFVTEPVEVDRGAPFVWHVGARELYVRPEGAGLLVSGCDETEVAPCDAVPSSGAVDTLAAKLAPLAPRLADLGIARHWACLRTFAPDRRFVVDWDEDVPWLFWVAGLGGHGATASASIGATAAARIAARVGTRLA